MRLRSSAARSHAPVISDEFQPCTLLTIHGRGTVSPHGANEQDQYVDRRAGASGIDWAVKCRP
jgi:hypothetical protein